MRETLKQFYSTFLFQNLKKQGVSRRFSIFTVVENQPLLSRTLTHGSVIYLLQIMRYILILTNYKQALKTLIQESLLKYK